MSWELIWWQIDLVRVDLVGIDLVRIDLVRIDLMKGYPNINCKKNLVSFSHQGPFTLQQCDSVTLWFHQILKVIPKCEVTPAAMSHRQYWVSHLHALGVDACMDVWVLSHWVSRASHSWKVTNGWAWVFVTVSVFAYHFTWFAVFRGSRVAYCLSVSKLVCTF